MLNSEQLFEIALGVNSPWKIGGVEFNEGTSGKEFHIKIDFKKIAKFSDGKGEM